MPFTIIITLALAATFVVAVMLFQRVAIYLFDKKRLRAFTNMSAFSGISTIPFFSVVRTGARSERLRQIHAAKKTDVLRIAPNHLSFSNPKAIKDIYGHGTKTSKDDMYVVGGGTHTNLADVVDKKDHARKRKVLSAAYALKNLEEWEFKVADKVERLFRHLDKCCTSPLPSAETTPRPEDLTVNMRQWINFFTVEAIADIGLSEKLGFLDRGSDMCSTLKLDGTKSEAPFFYSLYTLLHKQSLIIHSYQWYQPLNSLTSWIPGLGYRGTQASTCWDGIQLSRAQNRLDMYRRGEKNDDFFQSLMEDRKGQPQNLELGEIVAEINIMMNAGSATTAIAITNVLFHLLKNPEIYQKLRDEVDSILDPIEIIAPYDKVRNAPYLRACLDESLRLYTPTPQNLTRVSPPEGMKVLDYYVEGGVTVSMSAHVVHHDLEIFPDSFEYKPERWLGEEGKSLQQYLLSFSAGSRGCIGRNISYLEQSVLVSSLIHRYEFALPSPNWQLTRLETLNWMLGPMPVKIWRREMQTD